MRLSLVRGKGGSLAMIGGGLMAGTKVGDWEAEFFFFFLNYAKMQNFEKARCFGLRIRIQEKLIISHFV
jgi:hypothetical protein